MERKKSNENLTPEGVQEKRIRKLDFAVLRSLHVTLIGALVSFASSGELYQASKMTEISAGIAFVAFLTARDYYFWKNISEKESENRKFLEIYKSLQESETNRVQ